MFLVKKVGTNCKSDQSIWVTPIESVETIETARTRVKTDDPNIVQLITKEAREIQVFMRLSKENKLTLFSASPAFVAINHLSSS